jgi:hypothetical protein
MRFQLFVTKFMSGISKTVYPAVYAFEVVLSIARAIIKNKVYAFEVVLSIARAIIKNKVYAFEVVLSIARAIIKNF